MCRAIALGIAVLCCTITAVAGQTDEWTQRQRIVAGSGGTSHFGSKISMDGRTAIVGAPQTNGRTGTAYIYESASCGWILTAELQPHDAAIDRQFGLGVLLCDDYAVVGAREEWTNGAGCVYVFQRDGGLWTEVAKLVPSDGLPGDQFGASLAMAGEYLFVGAWNSDLPYQDAGAVYVFRFEGAGWIETQKLVASDAIPGEDWAFGGAIAATGGTLIVGAPYADECGTNSGAAYVYNLDRGTWQESAILIAPDCVDGGVFGVSVAVDHGTIAIGGPRSLENGVETGAVYLYERLGTAWTLSQRLVPAPLQGGDQFGESIALRGGLLLGAAPTDSNGGTVYPYQRHLDGSWSSSQGFRALDTESGHQFGLGLAFEDREALIGAPVAGAGFVFELGNIGCPGDFNCDGTIDTLDVLAFLNAWAAGCS